ncbi:phage tail protein [Vibrio spartinae]|uniref:Phage P2 GpU n=1 Tax=Vibrio spartinae TaxID=1918945 RepID=A0A1N6M6K8_9VIBR|nr:phage tail protein [Vibrio spartinae]QMV14723.1 Phage protein U [Vibrio spartinae]SIO94997.1 Phage P2 GpU [Vibrio spartinae]
MSKMMSLGEFVFSLSERTPYEGLQRTSDGGWVTVPRYGQKPISQNMGQNLDKISINGTWFRGEGMDNMKALRQLQAQRKPLVLADGYGQSMGRWVIKGLQEKQDRIIDDGTAFVVGFSIELEEYAE